jgi:Spy/CpxP family protein refolding chaperone
LERQLAELKAQLEAGGGAGGGGVGEGASKDMQEELNDLRLLTAQQDSKIRDLENELKKLKESGLGGGADSAEMEALRKKCRELEEQLGGELITDEVRGKLQKLASAELEIDEMRKDMLAKGFIIPNNLT